MTERGLVEQVAILSSTLTAIEGRFARGQGQVEELEDFKSAVDDMRLRLWGLLSAAKGDDYRGLQERFRIRRVTEMCRGLSGDLGSGGVSGRHAELVRLQDAAVELATSIDQAREHAF